MSMFVLLFPWDRSTSRSDGSDRNGNHINMNTAEAEKELYMKKKFNLQDLDCANCAAKMEANIKKIDGVNDASVSFLTQKMTIDADDARFDEIMKEVVKVCKKVEPDCVILM